MSLAIATATARGLRGISVATMVVALAACTGSAVPTTAAPSTPAPVTQAPTSSAESTSAPLPSAPAPPEGGALPSAELPSGTPPDLPPIPDTLPPGDEGESGEPADLPAFLEASRAWFGERGVTVDDDALAASGAARCAAIRSAGGDAGTVALEDALAAADQAEPGYAREDLEELVALALTFWCPSVTVDPQPSGATP